MSDPPSSSPPPPVVSNPLQGMELADRLALLDGPKVTIKWTNSATEKMHTVSNVAKSMLLRFSYNACMSIHSCARDDPVLDLGTHPVEQYALKYVLCLMIAACKAPAPGENSSSNADNEDDESSSSKHDSASASNGSSGATPTTPLTCKQHNLPFAAKHDVAANGSSSGSDTTSARSASAASNRTSASSTNASSSTPSSSSATTAAAAAVAGSIAPTPIDSKDFSLPRTVACFAALLALGLHPALGIEHAWRGALLRYVATRDTAVTTTAVAATAAASTTSAVWTAATADARTTNTTTTTTTTTKGTAGATTAPTTAKPLTLADAKAICETFGASERAVLAAVVETTVAAACVPRAAPPPKEVVAVLEYLLSDAQGKVRGLGRLVKEQWAVEKARVQEAERRRDAESGSVGKKRAQAEVWQGEAVEKTVRWKWWKAKKRSGGEEEKQTGGINGARGMETIREEGDGEALVQPPVNWLRMAN